MRPTVVSEGGRLEADSLLKAGNMGTVLVMRDASNLDAAEVANSANRRRDGSEPDLQTWTSRSGPTGPEPQTRTQWAELRYLAGTGSRSPAGGAVCRRCSSGCDQLTLWSRHGRTRRRPGRDPRPPGHTETLNTMLDRPGQARLTAEGGAKRGRHGNAEPFKGFSTFVSHTHSQTVVSSQPITGGAATDTLTSSDTLTQ